MILFLGGVVTKIISRYVLPASLDYTLDDDALAAHNQRISAWKLFFSSSQNWQTITSAAVLNQKVHAGATTTVNRVSASLSFKLPFYIKTNVDVAIIELKNERLIILPDKMIIIKGKSFGAVSYDDLQITTSFGQFVEDIVVPNDAEVIGHTWQYINKDGSPDKRYSNNRQRSICRYGYATIKSGSELEIRLSCSDHSKISELSQLSQSKRNNDNSRLGI